jgi:putative ABC transport system permease protein
MYTLELTRQILREMHTRKLRSILALFGVIWGTMTVILLLALGQGFYTASKNNMNGFIEGTLLFNHGVTSMPFRGLPPGRLIHIRARDVIVLPRLFPSIQAASPVLLNLATITYGNKQISKVNTQGVTQDYFVINNYKAAAGGRFINQLDVQNTSLVVFIGMDLKVTLFGSDNAIGKQLFINGLPFTVIGVLQQMPDAGSWNNNLTIMPYTTAIKLWGDQDVGQIMVLPGRHSNSDTVIRSVKNYYANQFSFNPEDSSAMWIFDFSQIYAFFTWFFISIEVFLGFCGSMTLGVGALNVANIMFLNVTERTKEIGLRMAIGARRAHIMLQIMLETCVIMFLGGFIGLLMALCCVFILSFISLPSWLGHPVISPAVVVATFFVLAITGLCAGYLPARRAAEMPPVIALGF